MTILEAIILGLLQGLTEFIPISSSGHLVAAQYFMNGAGDHLFLEWINIGTVLALIIYFWPKIIDITKRVFQKRDFRLAFNIVIAMIPAGLAGFFLAGFIEKSAFFSSVWVVVVTLALVGVLLVVLERLPKFPAVSLPDFPMKRALMVGLAQVLALVPGTSRSGSTIITGRLMGLSRADAAEFSFLVSIPIMFGVIVKLLAKSSDRQYFVDNATTLIVGNAVAFIAGLLAVKFLMTWLEKRPLTLFGWYRIGLASVLALTLLLVQ